MDTTTELFEKSWDNLTELFEKWWDNLMDRPKDMSKDLSAFCFIGGYYARVNAEPKDPGAVGRLRIGDLVIDEDGGKGTVMIVYDDGDMCGHENDSAHPNPRVVGRWPGKKDPEAVECSHPNRLFPGSEICPDCKCRIVPYGIKP